MFLSGDQEQRHSAKAELMRSRKTATSATPSQAEGKASLSLLDDGDHLEGGFQLIASASRASIHGLSNSQKSDEGCFWFWLRERLHAPKLFQSILIQPPHSRRLSSPRLFAKGLPEIVFSTTFIHR
ncbi:MAG: hypothetical protein WCG66_10100 [bacterium]